MNDIDLRVGVILSVDEFPEARRPAWKLLVDVGDLGTLRASAQITRYPRESLVSRRVVVAVNLGEKQIANFISQCLVLAAVDSSGTPYLLGVDEGAEPGQRVS